LRLNTGCAKIESRVTAVAHKKIREEISSLEQGDSVACTCRFEITERALTERRGTPDRTTRDKENGLSGERKSRINQSSVGEQEKNLEIEIWHGNSGQPFLRRQNKRPDAAPKPN
jgi:hypothetical protein